MIPADGKYIVQVRESAYGGNGACQYRLHVGNFPRPTAVVPAGGKPGEELEVTFLGDPAGRSSRRSSCPPTRRRARSGCTARTPDGITPDRVHVPRQRPAATSIEAEPNDAADQATTPGAAPRRVQRRHREAGRRRLLQVRGEEGADVRRPLLRPPARLAARPGAVRRQRAAAARSPATTTRRPGQLLPLHRPRRRRVRRLGPRPPAEGRAGLLLPHRGDAGSAAHRRRRSRKVDGNNPRTRTGRRSPCRRAAASRRSCIASRADFGGPLDDRAGEAAAGRDARRRARWTPGSNVVPVVFEAKPDAAGRRVPRRPSPRRHADPKVTVPCADQLRRAYFSVGPNNTPSTCGTTSTAPRSR